MEIHSALFVKNLSYNVSTEDLFDLFGKFGAIRYVRIREHERDYSYITSRDSLSTIRIYNS